MQSSEFLSTIWGDIPGFVLTQPKTQHDGHWVQWPGEVPSPEQFYSPVVFTTKHRSGADVDAKCQVIYVDADKTNLNDFFLEPSITVETSPGSWHLYWLLDSPVSLGEAAALSQAVGRAHNMEPSAGISAKLLRVPGTVNDSSEKIKESGEPFTVTATSVGTIYSYQDLAAIYPPEKPKELPKVELDVPAEPMSTWELEERVPGAPSRLFDLMTWDPTDHPDDDRSSRLFELLNLLLEEGFTPEEAAALAWGAKLSSKYREQGRSFQDMWRFDVVKAVQNQLAQTQAEESGEALVPVEYTHSSTELLTLDERKFVEGHRTFIDDWVDDAYEVLHPKTPRQYFVANSMNLLSLCLAPYFGLYADDGYEMLTNWILNLGSQNSGKTSALSHERKYIRAVDALFDSRIDTGSSFSAPGLIKALKDKHNESSLVHADEAAATFRSWQQEAYNGARQLLMQLYNNGWLPKHLLSSKDTGNTEDVFVYLGVYLMGTFEATTAAMTQDLIADGMTARFIPVLAGALEQDLDDKYLYRTRKADRGEKDTTPDQKKEQFARDMQRLVKWSQKVNDETGVLTLEMTEEAHERYAHFSWALDQDARRHRNPDVAGAHARRLPMNVAKVATLLAAERYSDVVELSDLLVVMYHGQTWWENVLTVIDAVSDNEYTRMLNATHKWLIVQGGKVLTKTLFGKSPLSSLPPKDVDDHLRGLEQRGIIKTWKLGTTKYIELADRE